ncbi:MAG: two-component system, NarL family, sensor kinase [Acidimicrobiaceae bacterium]|jgi:signal transduction histidine kinase|nr:two-component system, NarL family, sensor kinase [Acidimicrobiaceae bacterium]
MRTVSPVEPTAAAPPAQEFAFTPPPRPASGRRITVRSAVVTFVAADLAAVILITIGVAWLVSRSATAGAVRDARDLTVAEGRAAVWPLLTDGVVHGDPGALAALDQVVKTRVLSDRLVRVKIWSAGGTILYSDEPRLIGQHYGLDHDDAKALTSGNPEAGVSNLAAPENLYERQFKKLLQVYDGLRTSGGQPVLFEAYIKFSSVTADSHRAFVSVLPAMLAGLLLLFLAQVPLAWAMARRLETGQIEQQRLLQRAISSADVERRHIAADLHDGPVQALAGTALSLTAAAEHASTAGLSDVAATVSRAAGELRQGIRDLRTLIVAIAPPRLHDEGLAVALQDLVSPLRARGVEVSVTIPDRIDLPRGVEALAYRTAQEAIRNIGRHASTAHRVTVTVTQPEGRFHLEIADDGPGFSPATVDAHSAQGHVGLHLLGELAGDAGGRLDVHSDGHTGTRLRLELPIS